MSDLKLSIKMTPTPTDVPAGPSISRPTLRLSETQTPNPGTLAIVEKGIELIDILVDCLMDLVPPAKKIFSMEDHLI